MTITRVFALVAILLCALPAQAQESNTFTLTLKNNHFEPATLEVPANTRLTLMIDNQDDAAEEFESHDLSLEKMIPAHAKIPLKVGPLAAGEYTFFGELHEATAQGKLIVK